MRMLGLAAGYAGAVVCAAGGIYLISLGTGGEDNFLEMMANGLGIYCIGKGLFVAANTSLLLKAG